MSLITRCTACETLFRVVPDQLRVSDGWVRCGQCGEVFDGAANLVEGTLPASLLATEVARGEALPGTPNAAQPDTPNAAPPEASVGRSADAEAEPDPAAISANDAESERSADPEPAPDPDPAVAHPDSEPQATEGTPLQARGVAPSPDDRVTAAQAHPPAAIDLLLPAQQRESSDIPWPPEQSPTADAVAEPAPSFLRDRAPPSRWHRPMVRASLASLALVLFSLLAVQVARHERDRLAALAPAWRAPLAQLCAWTGCRVEAPRQIESVIIDSSSFARVRGDVYQLSFSLRNGAPVDLAMPSVELSVTNSQDQPLARRVLYPADMGTATPALGAGMGWSAKITLHVRTATPSDRVAGYRLLAFYP